LYVRKQYSQFSFITINYVEFHPTYIYIHIDLLLKDDRLVREAPTNPTHTSNPSGLGKISDEGGHR
jgi:hypothetical protein